MTFEVYSAGQNTGTKKSDIDFDALNKYTVETAGLQTEEVLIGIVSGLIDLGTQEQEDGSIVFTGDEDDEAAEIKKFPSTWFEDGADPNNPKKTVRLKKWKQKAIQHVTYAVDFPDILLQKGKFFGDEDAEPRPLRLFLGGQFYIQGTGMVVGKMLPLKEKTNTKGAWSFDKKHTIYAMASGAKLVDASKDEVFKPNMIDKLLGQALSFKVQVYFRENKGKSFYTESIKYVSGLGRGQKAPEYDFEPFVIQFNQENDATALKELRSHIKNTVKQASNYEGSKLQQQLEALYEKGSQETESEVPPEEPKTKAPATPRPKAKKVEKEDDLSADVPF